MNDLLAPLSTNASTLVLFNTCLHHQKHVVLYSCAWVWGPHSSGIRSGLPSSHSHTLQGSLPVDGLRL